MLYSSRNASMIFLYLEKKVHHKKALRLHVNVHKRNKYFSICAIRATEYICMNWNRDWQTLHESINNQLQLDHLTSQTAHYK